MFGRIMALAASLVFCASAAFADASDDLRNLIDDEWSTRLAENPLTATFNDVHDYNDRLPSAAPADIARRLEQDRAFLARLRDIDRDALLAEDQLNYDLFGFVLSHRIDLAAFETYRTPFVNDSGFHTALAFMIRVTPFRTVEDYEAYIARLEAIPSYLEQNTENMRRGLADGFTQPKEILEGVESTFANMAVDSVEDSAFFRPFDSMPDHFSRRDRNRLRAQGTRVIESDVLPAFRALHAFFRDDYMVNARDTLGASDLPNGEAFYENRVRYYTTLSDVTADDIHEIGLREVARIRGEMDEVIASVRFDGDFAEFIEFLRTDPQFYATSAEELIKEASYAAKRIDAQMPAFFGRLARQPYGVEPVPAEIAPNYTTGRYVSAPPDSPRSGLYWVNTYALDKRPLYSLTALTLHEAVPGHHHQIALSQELEGVPAFRRDLYLSAFGEGWGLYSEKLGVEMGVYDDAYDEFGRLSYEMWRACRLVIDTGVHAKGWTRDQALAYLADNTALSLHNVRTEVDRYIAWPGQALSYKMGELTILELRARAERELGADFDIRGFHDAVLANGSIPMEILGEKIDAYIAAEKAR